MNGKVKTIYELDYQTGKWVKVSCQVKDKFSTFNPKFRPGAGKLYFISGLILLAPEGKPHRAAFLGVQPAEAGDPAAYPEPTDGVKVKVIADLPAAKAGLKSDDVIIEIDGKKIGHWFELTETINKYDAGAEVQIKVRRNEAEMEFKVILGKR